jgi:hypothetical protein
MEGVKVEKDTGPPPPKNSSRYYRGSSSNHQPTTAKAEPKFQGRNEDLKGHVFDCANGKQADQYAVTMKEIAEYIGSKYAYGADICWSLEHEALFVVPKPMKPADDTDAIDVRIFEKEVDEYVKRKAKHTENSRKLFLLILGQCTEYLRVKLKALPEYLGMKEDFNVFNLIKAIKGITYKFEESSYYMEALHNSKIRLFMLRQGKDMTNDKFLELFQTHVAVFEQFGGEICRDPIVLRKELETLGIEASVATEKELRNARKIGKDNYLEMALIRGADRGRYSRLMDDLKNHLTMGHNNYPRNITAAYNLLLNYRITKQPQQSTRIINDSERVSFATIERPDVATVMCYRCQKKGHYASSCHTKDGHKDSAAPARADGPVTEALHQLVLADPPDNYSDCERFSFHQA